MLTKVKYFFLFILHRVATVCMFGGYRHKNHSADFDEKCQKLFLEISENVNTMVWTALKNIPILLYSIFQSETGYGSRSSLFIKQGTQTTICPWTEVHTETDLLRYRRRYLFYICYIYSRSKLGYTASTIYSYANNNYNYVRVTISYNATMLIRFNV